MASDNITPKALEVEATLPPELREIFRQLVEEYRFLATAKTGRGYVYYEALAELVKGGWRPSGVTTADSMLANRETLPK